jgi:hypothetical protein
MLYQGARRLTLYERALIIRARMSGAAPKYRMPLVLHAGGHATHEKKPVAPIFVYPTV